MDELGPMAQEGAQGCQISIRAKGAFQQAVTVQDLDPLAISHIDWLPDLTLGLGHSAGYGAKTHSGSHNF